MEPGTRLHRKPALFQVTPNSVITSHFLFTINNSRAVFEIHDLVHGFINAWRIIQKCFWNTYIEMNYLSFKIEKKITIMYIYQKISLFKFSHFVSTISALEYQRKKKLSMQFLSIWVKASIKLQVLVHNISSPRTLNASGGLMTGSKG